MLGFDIDSSALSSRLPGGEVAVARLLRDQLNDRFQSRAVEVRTSQQIRGHMGNLQTANHLRRCLAGPVDMLFRYSDESEIRANCRMVDIWDAIWAVISLICTLMQALNQWRPCFHGSLVRLLKPEQRSSIHLDRLSTHHLSGNFVWVSVDATREFVGGLSWGA